MLSPNCLIQELIVPVPICRLTTCSTDLWSSLNRQELWGQGDRIAVVNQEELPIGVVYLHSLIPYLNSDEQFFEPQSSILPHPHSAILHSLVQPLKILPGNLSVREFWQHLQKLPTGNFTTEDWGVVNPEGKLLGLLDIHRLLQFLARHYQLQDIRSQKTCRRQPKNAKNTKQISIYSGTEPELAPEQKTVEVRDVMESLALATIEQVISPLPFPVKVQTQQGQKIMENLAWRQELGNLSAGQIFPKSISESRVPEPELASPLTRVSHLFSDSESEATLMCSLSNRSEQAWKFFKIPLEIDLSKLALLSGYGGQELSPTTPTKYSNDAGEQSQGKKLRSPPQPALKGVVKTGESSSPKLDHQNFVSANGSANGSAKSGMIAPKLTLENHERPGTFELEPRLPATEPPQDMLSKSLISLWLIWAENVTEQQQVAQDLVAKNADLVQLNRLKDEFLACISHELKTPLTAVLGLSTLLKDQALGPLNERQARYAKMIYQSGQHLMRVVNDILDLTRMETGQLQLNWEPVQITQVCEHAWQQAQETQQMELAAGHHSAASTPTFTLDIEPGLNTIVADHLRLRQMLYNLLSNALKFTPPEGAIGLKVNHWQGWIAFTVWDTGIGIPADKQHLIFQRFQQLENPLTRRFEGTGLGLVLTQGLARAHGGDVTFISKEEKGSQFTILLPPAPPESGTIKKFPVRDQLLILIVEAVPQYVEELHEQLSRLGYRVAISRCGIDALEKARRLQPCVIFVNPLLPLLSGWDLLILLKSDPQTGHIPVILTATAVDKKRAKKYRADGWISLPLNPSELQAQLRDLVPVELPQVLNYRSSKLTILRLTANVDSTNAALIQGLKIQSGKAYQILEADDLEQAELLAEIWQPQALLVEAAAAWPEPREFFQKLSQSRLLAKLPIVTMDLATTTAANQVPGLIVFPCLVQAPIKPENYEIHQNSLIHDFGKFVNSAAIFSERYSGGGKIVLEPAIMRAVQYLSQMLNLAVKMNKKPNILAVNLAALPEFYQTQFKGFSEDNYDPIEADKNSAKLQLMLEIILDLQLAKFNAAIGRSWSEMWHLIQQQIVDLLLIYIPVLPSASESKSDLLAPIVNGLKAIDQMANKPKIIIIYDLEKTAQQPGVGKKIETQAHKTDEEFLSFLKKIATKVLPISVSKEKLLQEIQQILPSANFSQ